LVRSLEEAGGFKTNADKLVRYACATAGVDRGVLFQRDRTDPRRMVAIAGVGPASEVIGETFSSDRGLAGEAMSTGRPALTSDYMHFATRLRNDFPNPVHAACAVPLGAHGHTTAAISLASTDPGHRFTDEDIERLCALSEQWQDVRWTPNRRHIWRAWPTVALAVLAIGLWTVRILTDHQLSSRPVSVSRPPAASTSGSLQQFAVTGLAAGDSVSRCVRLQLPGAHVRLNVEVTVRGELARDLAIRVEEGRLPPGVAPPSCRGFIAAETLLQSQAGGRPSVITYLQRPGRGLRSYRVTTAVRRGAGPDVTRRAAVVAVRASS
jgi:GAF domain